MNDERVAPPRHSPECRTAAPAAAGRAPSREIAPVTTSPARDLPRSAARTRALYREMLRIRRFEETLYRLVSEGRIGGTTHLCIGQEAVPVGVSACLAAEDLVVSTHRGHGHLLAKGARLDRALAEIAGRELGYCAGKGGSQHVAVPALGHLGSNGITGGGLPIAAGLALAQRLRGTGRCAVAYLGDGAADTGNFHETLNLAALWRLPVVFVLENNGYAMSTPVERSSACAAFVDWADRYTGMATARVDGNDVYAVADAAAPLLERARRGDGPALLECLTYRQSGHSKSDPRVYRSRDEENAWRARDPLDRLATGHGLDAAAVAELGADVERELDAAIAAALASPPGGRELAIADLDVPALPRAPAVPRRTAAVAPGTEVSLIEALRETLHQELAADDTVVLIGEDLGCYGGAFGVTRGLEEAFGRERVRETPICENSFTGLGVGAAVGGLRPVVELMFGDFVTCCMDALVNHAAKLRYMYRGQVTVPFTLRMPVGRRKGYGATHSQSLEAWFVHVPGLQVVFPATVADAVGLLRTAIRTDAPVIFCEHKLLYPVRGAMPELDHLVPLGSARVDRPGRDLTLITYGNALSLCRAAADHLAGRGHDVEILDLRSLAPYDRDACVASLRRTGRGVFVQETNDVGGVCDRVLADVLPDVFGRLRAPLRKVGAAHAPVPSSPELEEAMMPGVRDVVRAALPLLEEY
ncbi:MAG: dehydrogenase [Planctomycetes bacterium]|nr:dehydrogenase [Planctomycetota bacterium]